MNKILQTTVFVLASLGVHAQMITDSSLLDPVTVTAGLSPTHASKTGRNIQVLSGKLLQRLPINSVDEALRYISGIEVQARGPMGAQADISMRGSTFQQVLVVLDGLRLNDPNTGHFNGNIPVALAEIDRIEVLKGPASAIYGTEAVGGVIHIITKAFAQKSKTTAGNAQFVTGEYGLANVQAGLSGSSGKHHFSGGLLSNHSSGQPQRGTHGFFDLSTVSLGYGVQFNSKWHAALRSAYDYRSFAAQNFYTSFASDTSSEKVKSYWNQAQLGYTNQNFSWNLQAGYKWLNDQFLYNKQSTANNNTSQLTQLLSTAQWKIKEHSSFITGAQYLSKQIKSNDRGNHQLSQLGVFAIWQQALGENWRINPAVRAEYNQQSGWSLLPQFTFLYQAGKLQFRGVAGRTLRDADFTERYNNYNKDRVTGGSIGNPNLETETSFSYEFGLDYSILPNLKWQATYFSRLQNRVIDFVTTPYANMPRQDNLVPGGSYALASNVAKTNVGGVESDLNYVQSWKNQQIVANFGLVWLNTQVKAGKPGFYLSSHAKFMSNFSVLYQVGQFGFAVNGIYKLRNEQSAAGIHASITPSYFVWNTKASAKLLPWLTAFMQIDNVGNVKYADLLGSTMPKRWLMGGVSCSF